MTRPVARHGGRPGRTTLLLVVGTTIASGMPVFLVSTIFVQIASDTGAPVSALGVVVAAFWVAAALVSPMAGPIAERVGSRRLAMIAVGLAAASLAGTAAASPSWHWLTAWAAVGGAANALGHPASNQMVVLSVPARRHAFAYGIKQGSVPLTSLAGGAAVPLVALTVGWRWAFVVAAVACVALLVAYRRRRPAGGSRLAAAVEEKGARLGAAELRRLAVVAAACLFAAGASTTIVSFGVTGAVGRGLAPATAGLLMSLASVLAGTARVVAGLLADRGIGGSYRTIALMQGLGALGILVMAWPSQGAYVAGFLVAVAFGWGWPGLMHFAISRSAGPSAAAATGIVSIGNYVGNAALPLVFGLLYGKVAESATWLIAGGALALASLVMLRLHAKDGGSPSAPQVPAPPP